MLDTQTATVDTLMPPCIDVDDQPRSKQVELLKADDIKITFDRVENEIIPLGNFKIEVVMADVPLTELLLDAENPRIQLRLNLKKDKSDRSQANLRTMMWDLDEVKKLKKTIEMNGGLIEAIIISGDDGTVFEGNSRVTCIWQLWEEDGKKPDSPWAKVKARILPPGVNRRMIDALLGELHVKGKNKWVPFEQAAFLYRMNKQGDGTHEWLAQKMGMSKTYVGNKIKAFSLMQNTYIPMLKENGKEVKDDVASQWSWFEEFYKACRPGSKPKKDELKKIYDDQELEEKFCKWMMEDQLPEAADVRKLAKCLSDDKAVALLDRGQKIDKAFALIAGRRPELASPLWKDVEKVADLLESIELTEIDALRDKDPGRVRLFDRLADAMQKIRKEVTR